MNRSDLIQIVVELTNLEPDVVTEVLDATVDVIRLAVAKGERITIRHLGRFEPKAQRETFRRIPGSKKLIYIHDRPGVRFVPASTFVTMLRQTQGRQP